MKTAKAMRAAFTANWLLAGRLPGPRRASWDPASAGAPQFVTAVVRLPPQLAGDLADAASRLPDARSRHYLYPPSSIHLTVLGLGGRAGLDEVIGATARRHSPFAVEVRGLNVSRETVFAELYPEGSGLRELREALRRVESREHGWASRWLRRRFAHANLLRFAAPVDRSLLAGVRAMRGRRFGRFEVAEIELVRTDKVLSAPGTRTLGRFGLGAFAQGPRQPG